MSSVLKYTLGLTLLVIQIVAAVLGLLFLYAGLDGPTGIQEAAGGALASAMWVLVIYVYMVRRDYLS
jgi:hypothetical protein